MDLQPAISGQGTSGDGTGLRLGDSNPTATFPWTVLCQKKYPQPFTTDRLVIEFAIDRADDASASSLVDWGNQRRRYSRLPVEGTAVFATQCVCFVSFALRCAED